MVRLRHKHDFVRFREKTVVRVKMTIVLRLLDLPHQGYSNSHLVMVRE